MNGRSAFTSGLIAYLRTPFHLIVWFMETFAKNRTKIKAFLERQKVAGILRTVVMLTLLGWLLVFAFLATGEDGDRFSCAVKSFWPQADLSACPPDTPAPR